MSVSRRNKIATWEEAGSIGMCMHVCVRDLGWVCVWVWVCVFAREREKERDIWGNWG